MHEPAIQLRNRPLRGCDRLPQGTERRRLRGNNTRQGSTRKGILKPAGFLFLGSGHCAASGSGSPR